MPLRPTRPLFPGQAAPAAGTRRPVMPAQATTRPVAPARPTTPPQTQTTPATSRRPATPYGRTRSAQANVLGKATSAAAKAGTLTGAGQAAAAKARKGTIGPANPPALTPVRHRGKGFAIREPRQRGER